MKFLFISSDCDFLPVALRVKEEGNDVAVFIKSARARRLGVYKGILDEIYDTLSAAFDALGGEPDAVIFDHVGMGDLADELRKHNLHVWGASKVADKLEKDRVYGLQVMQQVGIQIPLTSPHLESIADAQSFMRQHPDIERWVAKFEGENAPRSTVIGTVEEIINALDTLLGEGEGTRFILQQFVEGIEISTEVWVSGGRIVDPANATLETKRYLSGDLGPNTGCMTSIVWAYEDAMPRIVEEGIGKMEDWLREQNFNGPIDLNTIVNDEGIWGLEWTPRHGYNAVYALFSLFDDELGRVLADAARGQLRTMPVRTSDVSYAIRVYMPPAPFTGFVTGVIYERLKKLEKRGEDIKSIAQTLERVGIEVAFQRGTGELVSVDIAEVAAGELIQAPDDLPAEVWWLDVKRDRAGRLVTAGLDGIICEVTAAANRLSTAVRLCEETVKEIKIAAKCWRNDGHLRAFDAAALRGLGYEVPDAVFK